jgi:hypothetical protein
MFCPKCSEAQVSDDVRFCKRCGLPLEAVHELIANEAVTESEGSLPQRYISIGAALMFIGSAIAMFWYRSHLGGDSDVLPQVFLILGFSLGFILLLFQPLLAGLRKLFSDSEEGSDGREKRKPRSIRAKQRDGTNLGALLMFLGTIKAMVLSTLIRDPSQRPVLTIAMATVGLMILMVIRWLVGGVYQLFFADSVEANKARADRVTADLSEVKGASIRVLPPAEEDGAIPADAFASRKAELVQPPSVTEKTTGLLGK